MEDVGSLLTEERTDVAVVLGDTCLHPGLALVVLALVFLSCGKMASGQECVTGHFTHYYQRRETFFLVI